jgi:hypothetical protein
MKFRYILMGFCFTSISTVLTACDDTPYYNGKEITVISRRCDTSGCLDKVQYVEGHLPPFEVAPERIEWKQSPVDDTVKRLPGVK